MVRIRNSTIEEVADVCRLDKMVFSEKWDIPLIDGQIAWIKNNEIYRMVEKDNVIMGYHFVAPFTQEIYEKLLSGQLEEREAIHDILNYEAGSEVYLYLYSIVVDMSDSNYKIYSKPLVQDLAGIIHRLQRRSIIVKDFGFIAISEAGVRLAERLGLTFIKEFESEEKPNPQVYRAEPKNFKIHSLFHQVLEV
jgi:hypothetical protein